MPKWSGTQEEWEDLCDNCGKCCEGKTFQGPQIIPSGIMCPYREMGRCSVYPYRQHMVKSCKTVTPENVLDIGLPSSCAYVKWRRNERQG